MHQPPDDDLKRMGALVDAALARLQAGQQASENRRNRSLNRMAIGLAALSALFAAYQGFESRQSRLAFVRQADEQRRDARETTRVQGVQGERAIDLARRSADAAIESNRLSMRALAASQAANVTVMSFELDRDLTPGRNVEAQATIWNRGNLQAETTLVLGLLDPIRFQRLGGYETLDIVVGDRLHLKDPLPGFTGLPIPFRGPMHIVLPPGGMTTEHISTEPLLDENEIRWLKQGAATIHVLAFVEYGDGFGQKVRRGFCGVYDARTPRTFNFCTGFRFRFDKTAFKQPPLDVSVERAQP